MKDYQESIQSELLSYGVTYPEMARATGLSEGQLKMWMYRGAINEDRYILLKRGIKKVIENRLTEAQKAKEAING
jgi:hypothetical protein